MGMLRPRDDEKPEREISLWLERWGYSLQKYKNLLPVYKCWLHEQLYGQTSLSDAQKRSLHHRLWSPAGRTQHDFITSEQLQERFTPINRNEKLPSWKMF